MAIKEVNMLQLLFLVLPSSLEWDNPENLRKRILFPFLSMVTSRFHGIVDAQQVVLDQLAADVTIQKLNWW